MADDLSKPLMGTAGRRRGITPGAIVLTILAAGLAGFAIYVMIDTAPDLDPSLYINPDGTPVEAETPGEVVIRVPETEVSGVVIRTPDGAEVGAEGPLTAPGAALVLTTQPDPELLGNGPYGPLPRIAADGRRPFDVYARPSPSAGSQPRVAIVVGGIGINQAGTELALSRLPGEVTLAIAPYGANLGAWVARAREAGHELLLQVPLEPADFPTTDPGEHTLLVDDPVAANLDRLRWLLAQVTSYAGVVSYAGGRFLTEPEAMAPFVDELAARGLMLLDEGAVRQSGAPAAAAGFLPFAAADMVLDANVDAASIAAQLAQLTALARERGYAIATASAFPVTIEQIAAWAPAAAAAGIVLVPVTALANDPQDATTVRVE